jgi:hypothetical protein
VSEEQDVRAVIEGIGETFSELDVDRWLSHFNPQHAFVYRGAVFVAKSLADTKNAFAPEIRRLKESGFRHSALDLCNIKLIEPNLAIAATRWRRLGEGDKLLEKLGITYTLLKTPSGWKVVVAIAHDAGVVLVE